MTRPLPCPPFFFFNDTATTEIYTLSLHDALPISVPCSERNVLARSWTKNSTAFLKWRPKKKSRSEEHTSELQSRLHLVCRLLLEKKKQNTKHAPIHRHKHPTAQPRK